VQFASVQTCVCPEKLWLKLYKLCYLLPPLAFISNFFHSALYATVIICKCFLNCISLISILVKIIQIY
jgi:hypothetical protein